MIVALTQFQPTFNKYIYYYLSRQMNNTTACVLMIRGKFISLENHKIFR